MFPTPLSLILLAGLVWPGTAAVREVNRSELQEFVKASEETIVYFYAKWCRACDAFHTIYESLSEKYQIPGQLEFVKFDAGTDRPFGVSLVDDSYPGLALLHGEDLVDRMRSIKTRENSERWIEQMTGPSVEVLGNKEDAEKRGKRFAVAFIASVPSRDSEAFGIIFSVAEKHRDWAKWIVIEEPAATTSSISVKHPFEKIKKSEFTSAEELTEWADRYRFPLFGLMDGSNQYAYYKTNRNPAMLVGTHQDFRDHGITFRKLAVAYQDKFSFVWFKSDQEGARSTLSSMMVNRTPALVAFSGTGTKREHKRFVYPGDDLNDLYNISQFLDGVLSRKIRPTVKSMSGEADSSGKYVVSVPAMKFEELVLHHDKDFMLVLTYPKGDDVFKGCVDCGPLIRMLEQLAPLLEKELGPRIGFGEFPVTENEMPMFDWGGSWELEELPVIYLVKAGATTPIEYKGKMDARSILEFWEKNTDDIFVKRKRISENMPIKMNLKFKPANKDEL